MRDTEPVMSMAGSAPASKSFLSRYTWPSVIEIELVGM